MKKETPTYYAILPAPIRYADDLSEFQKLLYAEITALAQANGYCYASNSYFSKLYKKWSTWISQNINKMATLGYLQIEHEKEKGNLRKIYIGEIQKLKKSLQVAIPQNWNSPIPEKWKRGIPEKWKTPITEKWKYNNINTNTTSVNRVNNPPPSSKNIEFINWMRDVEIRGKSYISVWNEKTWSSEIMNSELKKGIYDIRSVAITDFSSRVEKFVAIKDLIVRKKAEKYFFFPVWDWTLQDFLKHVNKFYGEDSVILSRLARSEEKQKAVRILIPPTEERKGIKPEKTVKGKVDLTEFKKKASAVFGR